MFSASCDLRSRSFCSSRIVSDAIFAEAMGVLEVAAWRRSVMYLAVRFFGGFARNAEPER